VLSSISAVLAEQSTKSERDMLEIILQLPGFRKDVKTLRGTLDGTRDEEGVPAVCAYTLLLLLESVASDVNALHQANGQDIDTLKEYIGRAVQELREEHSSQLDRLHERHLRQLDELLSKHTQSLSQVRELLSETAKRADTAREALEARLGDLVNDVERLKSDQAKTLGKVEACKSAHSVPIPTPGPNLPKPTVMQNLPLEPDEGYGVGFF